ncbi:MAG: TRAP transporter large permease [Deltaproteobacteria bacterium]|nr:TRAP transporter large permease [Deltaproteobacteria bacterium]
MITVASFLVIALALAGLPLFLVIGASAMLGYLGSGQSMELFFASNFRPLATNPVFLAIPLFTLAGYLMAQSRAPERMVRLSRAAVGWMPGGLAIVALIACAGFTAFTGASGVTIVALGGLLMPTLIKDGYPRRFALGLLTTGGSRGLLFPPSLPLIIYAMIAGLAMEGVQQMEANIDEEMEEVEEAATDPDSAQAALDDELDDILAEDDAEGEEGDEEEFDDDDLDDMLADMDDQGKKDLEARATEDWAPGSGPDTAVTGARAPPSHVSVDRLFVAGAVPGALALLLVAIYSIWFGVRRKVPRTRFAWRELGRAFVGAAWEVPIPFIIIVGIYGGFFTAIDGAAIIAAYVFFVEVVVYRDIRIGQLPHIFRESMVLVGGILLIMMSALALTNYFIDREIPQQIFALVRETITSPITFLLALNVFLLVVGTLMDIFSAILVVVPMITPIAVQYGIDPVHLGIIFLTNLEMGFSTPPVGVNLFVGSLAFRRPVVELYRAALPYLGLSFISLMLITYWSDLSLWLVRVTGVQ